MKTLPIWLVVGFLGSGKTTVLRRLAHHANARGLIFIVNEFSSVDVDTHQIEREGGTALTVSGGSIFCRCRITEFISALSHAAEGIPMSTGERLHPQGVIIEASGITDPRSMGRLLHESELDKRFHIAGVTAVVDPATFSKLLLVLPNIRNQVESADLILLNKTDLHSTETLTHLNATLLGINPTATIVSCTHGHVRTDLLLRDGTALHRAQMDADVERCRDPHFENEALTFSKPLDTDALRTCFQQADESLYRVKGAILTTEGWCYLDWSAGRLSLLPCPPSDTSTLIFIWNPARRNTLLTLFREQDAKPSGTA